MEIPAADRLARFISIVFRLPAAVGVIFNAIEIEIVISPSVPARRGGLGLFLLYFHHVIFNAIEIEIVISPSVPARRGGLGLFLLYFHRISPARPRLVSWLSVLASLKSCLRQKCSSHLVGFSLDLSPGKVNVLP